MQRRYTTRTLEYSIEIMECAGCGTTAQPEPSSVARKDSSWPPTAGSTAPYVSQGFTYPPGWERFLDFYVCEDCVAFLGEALAQRRESK